MTRWSLPRLLVAFVCLATPISAQDETPPTPARLFLVPHPLSDAAVNGLIASARGYLRSMAERRVEPVLVFEFAPTRGADPSELFLASRLAVELSTSLAGARRTIAYVPAPVAGYSLLPILACDEIVLGERATLGPITPDDQPVSPIAAAALRDLADRKGRDRNLLLGLLDPELPLREVRTADGKVQFVPASELDEVRRTRQVVSDAPAWEGTTPGVLRPETARRLGIASLIVDQRSRLFSVFNLDADLAGPGVPGEIRPVVIPIQGPVDAVKLGYVKRRIGQAINERNENLLIFQIDSEGGEIEAINAITVAIAELDPQKVKTVAFVEDRAVGLAALIPLACDEIILATGARWGDVTHTVDRRGQKQPIPAEKVRPLADRAADLAAQKSHPRALARALVDPQIEIVAARDTRSGAIVSVAAEDLELNPGQLVRLGTVIKPAGQVLSLDASQAKSLGMAARTVTDLASWIESEGFQPPRRDQPTWVDTLVTVLNSQWMSGILLFVGLFMLILELKLPGVGLPAIVSALCFLLFFWSHYLGGTADQLEILLFLAGVVGLFLELFVFPGFGVFGVTGIVLILSSIVMASHTFVWPTQEYEYRQLGGTLLRLLLTLLAVAIGAVLIGRFLPSLPLFRHLILVPEGAEPPGQLTPIAKPPLDSPGPLTFLLGERGTTTTVCRPTGKARFGEALVDVVADGVFLEANTPVEVIDVRGSTAVVQRLPG
ncbi:MAG: nodulation protein NfeD [Isosphaeraceae bacterium]|jgi:membrane-bound serine protease (ClpP class)|nr:MAG: nodulation protein NfeD [Isosphaeraceae bacterium]